MATSVSAAAAVFLYRPLPPPPNCLGFLLLHFFIVVHVLSLLFCFCSLLTKSKIVQSISSRQPTTDSKPCELIGHVNVYHLFRKVQDVCMLLIKSPHVNLLGLCETRLDSCVGDESLSIPSYTILWRDAARRGQTGMGLYVHKSIVHITKRRADLESERVECMCAEVRHSFSNATLVGYVYRNPAVTYAWFDDFVDMMDKVNECNSNIVLLGDFNIDLFKSQNAWESIISLFGLHQHIRYATRITQTSATLLDHMYTGNE